jgi:polysaccharide deacetylase family protein (PEP-CTERM system associated)
MSSTSQTPGRSTAIHPDRSMAISPPKAAIRNCMSVDVEEHFQVQAFASTIDRADWDTHDSRVERNTDRVLKIFDDAGIKATFFSLGWVAERHPDLIRRIVAGGHELASHGYSHALIHSQSPDQFRADVRRTKGILEDIGGVEVRGYRAATFSLDKRSLWAHDVLGEEGYLYSSSIFPVKRDNYGMPDAPRTAYRTGDDRSLIEVPLTTVRVFGRNLPYFSGGGFFRLIPYPLSRMAFRHVNRRDHAPCIFYFHPWEIDPDQPRIAEAPLKSRIRHYINLGAMERKIRAALRDFAWARMDEVFLSDPPAASANDNLGV